MFHNARRAYFYRLVHETYGLAEAELLVIIRAKGVFCHAIARRRYGIFIVSLRSMSLRDVRLPKHVGWRGVTTASNGFFVATACFGEL